MPYGAVPNGPRGPARAVLHRYLQSGVMHEAAFAKRRIGNHRYAALLAPWQQVTLNAAAADVVQDLIGRAAMAVKHAPYRL